MERGGEEKREGDRESIKKINIKVDMSLLHSNPTIYLSTSIN